MAALIVARREGRVGGRKTVMKPKRLAAALKLLAGAMPVRDVATAIGMSFPTLYRHLPAPLQDTISADWQGWRQAFSS